MELRALHGTLPVRVMTAWSSVELAVTAMRPVLKLIELIERVGPSDANVLINGENGTGKRRHRPRLAPGV